MTPELESELVDLVRMTRRWLSVFFWGLAIIGGLYFGNDLLQAVFSEETTAQIPEGVR